MIRDPDFQEACLDALHRIYEVRGFRCGEGEWRDPPADWPSVIVGAWPRVWLHAPRVPSGWVDVVLALSEHLVELRPDVRIYQATEDLHGGGMSLKVVGGTDGALDDVVAAYESIPASICRVCGGAAKLSRTGSGRLAGARAVCDKHADGAW